MRFLSLVLIMSCLLVELAVVEAVTERRYRQRNNRIAGHIWVLPNEDSSLLKGPVQLSYARNFKMFEAGLFGAFNLNIRWKEFSKSLQSVETTLGLSFRFNIISNTRTNNHIPSVGLKLGYQNLGGHAFFVHPFLSYEYFLASRSSIGVSIDYQVHAYPFALFKGISAGAALVYYFH